MSRYIDADKLKERIPKDIHEDVFENCSNCELLDDEQVKELIDLQPTADVVEVVRCKDCKHRKKNTFCLHNMRYEDNNGFCSYGERKES